MCQSTSPLSLEAQKSATSALLALLPFLPSSSNAREQHGVSQGSAVQQSHPSICPQQYLASFHFWVANNPVLFTQLVRLMDPPTFSEHPHHCTGVTEVQGLSRFTGLSFSESLALCCLGAPGDPLSNPRSPHPTAPSPVFLPAPVSPVLSLIVDCCPFLFCCLLPGFFPHFRSHAGSIRL